MIASLEKDKPDKVQSDLEMIVPPEEKIVETVRGA